MTQGNVTEVFVGDLIASFSPTAEISELFTADLTTSIAHASSISELLSFALVYQGPCTTTRQTLWYILREDGTQYGFTSYDRPFPWRGITFQPCASLADSAADSSAEIGSIASISLTGLLESSGITDAEIYGGLFDNAYVEVWDVNYGAGSTEFPSRIAAGWMGKVSRGQTTWTAEVLGPGSKIKQTALVQFCTPGCRWTFGDLKTCDVDGNVNLAGRGADCEVTGNIEGRFAFDFSGMEPSDGSLWNNGTLLWTSGRNAGVKCQTNTVDWFGPVLSLWDLAPFPPEVGDTFTLFPGCPKTVDGCKAYNNIFNFGGFPDVPGPDALQQNADSLFTGNNG